MKKIAFILVILVAMFAIIGCGDVGDGIDDGNGKLVTKRFWAQTASPQTFYQLDAEKLAENSVCEVWAEIGSDVTKATANNIAYEYANNIYPKMMNTFGHYNVTEIDLLDEKIDLGKKMNTMEIAHWIPTGKTSGAKLTILLLDIRDSFQEGVNNAYVGGYFYPLDLLGNDPDYPQYKSNVLDMIYLDTYPSVPGSDDSNETLAHEMQHLMNFVSSVVFRNINLMETWIDEGLSAAAQWVYTGEYSEGRLDHYNKDYSGLIAKGNNFYVWNNRENESIYANLDDYATVYLFFQWLRLQSGGSTKIYSDIHKSNFSNYEAVTDAATKIDGIYNNWQLLLRDWHAANFTNAASGRYGYRGDSTLKNVKAPMVAGGTTSLNLFPGEGVYSSSTTGVLPWTPGNIRYAGLPPASGSPSDTNSFASGARLTYNVNVDWKNGTSESGSTTGIAAPSVGISMPGGSVQIGSNKFTGPFKVDMSYFRRKNGNRSISDNAIRNLLSKNNSGSINGNTLRFDRSTVERVFIDE
jgi:hypothetical protein